MTFEEADFISLDDFSLKWRWTDKTWNELPKDDLKTIRPTVSEKAKELCEHSLKYFSHYGLSANCFINVALFETSTREKEEVANWLRSKLGNNDEELVVCWDMKTAAIVGKDVFVKYWDDFCYPASDDVSIFPLDLEWMLGYFHDEYFEFGHLSTVD